MSFLAIGQSSGPALPALEILIHQAGLVVAPNYLRFAIFDVSTSAKQDAPVQVYPSSGTHDADFATPAPAGDRMNLGWYVARYTPANNEPIGRHQIRWTYEITATDPTTQITTTTAYTVVRDFDVLAAGTAMVDAGPAYALVSDLRDEGITTAQVNDTRVQRLIVQASRFVEMTTGRYFAARRKAMRLDGSGNREILFYEPIVALVGATIDSSPYYVGDLPVDANLFRVYSRHISQGLLSPDDRDNPKISFFHGTDHFGVRFVPTTGLRLLSLVWPMGQQNVKIDGVFGYTDPDGVPTSTGKTPDLIRHATKLLVMRELPRMQTDRDAREDAQNRWRLLAERTRDQSYNRSDLGIGGFTGDLEIDRILARYQRPVMFGSI